MALFRLGVLAGNDHVADRCLVAVGQLHFSSGISVSESVAAGSAVEIGDEFTGGSEHDRVQPGGPVGNPRAEGVLDRLGEVADVHAAMIKVEPECARVAVAKCEGGSGFG
jgi:hypothetical protein